MQAQFDLFSSVTTAIQGVAKILRLRKPRKVFLVIRKEEDGMLKFVLVLPAPGAHDVMERKVNLQIGESEPLELTVPGNTLETQEFVGQQDDTVSGSLVDVDDVGNESEPRDFSFVLTDTLAPPQPGEVGARVTEETEPTEPEVPTDPEVPTEPETPEEPTV